MLKKLIMWSFIVAIAVPLTAMQPLSEEENKALNALKKALEKDKKVNEEIDPITLETFFALMKNAESGIYPLVVAIVPTETPDIFHFYDAHSLAKLFIRNINDNQPMSAWEDPLNRFSIKKVYTAKYVFKKTPWARVYKRDFVYAKTYSNLYFFILSCWKNKETFNELIKKFDTYGSLLFRKQDLDELSKITQGIFMFNKENPSKISCDILQPFKARLEMQQGQRKLIVY